MNLREGVIWAYRLASYTVFLGLRVWRDECISGSSSV
jgi:hypothetical protein